MRKVMIALGLCALILCFYAFDAGQPGGSASGTPSHRQTEITVAYTRYEWWLMRWMDNEFMCQVYADHEGIPTNAEVYKSCDSDIYMQWLSSGPCIGVERDGNTTTCPGLYIHFIGSEPKKRTVIVDLPEPRAWITLIGCPPKPLNNYCANMPSLLILAEETLPNEYPSAIHGSIGGVAFSCEAPFCKVPLRPTDPQGTMVDFWMDSSYGDSSEHYKAKVRVVQGTTVEVNQSQPGVYVDILSSQWRGNEPATGCAECWQSFPVIGESVEWLTSPPNEDGLRTDDPLAYLAGRLIANGAVNASECPASGLMLNGWASACGMEKARSKVQDWQNRFDDQIIQASQETGVPSRLLKNLLAQESQFWPGSIDDALIKEYGMGRMTEVGSDALLLVNEDFFKQFCPLVLAQTVCDEGYLGLSEEQRSMLRGAVAVSVHSDCSTCQAGIDFSKSNFNIGLVAKTLEASCEQTGAIVTSVSGKAPGDAATYQDLWRFTLTNYHAGPGCLLNALTTSAQAQEPLRWDQVSAHLEPACQSAINFVERVSHPGMYFTVPEPTSDAQPSPTIGAADIPSPTPTPTLQPTETPTATPTPGGESQPQETPESPDLSPESVPPTAEPTSDGLTTGTP